MLKISYMSGPANVPRFLTEMERGTPSDYFGTNYMKLFLKLAKDIEAQAQIFTWHGEDLYETELGRYGILNWPIRSRGGLRHHVSLLTWNLAALWRMIRFRPNIVLLTGNQNYWWIYAPLRLFGARFIASFHSVLWPKYRPVPRHLRVFNWLNGRLLLRRMSAILATSQDIREQIVSLLGLAKVPIIDHLPSYAPTQFDGIVPPSRALGSPFEILFMGRLEPNKGVYDLLAFAEQLHRKRPGEFLFHVAGEGSQSEHFASKIHTLSLTDVVLLYGHCGPSKIRELLSKSHVCVVPTRSDCEAGFEMVCAEAILAERPLVSSRVCPAIYYLADATVEVPPDDVAEYRAAIEALADSPELYARKQAACASLKSQFLEPRFGWEAAMHRAIALATGIASAKAEISSVETEANQD